MVSIGSNNVVAIFSEMKAQEQIPGWFGIQYTPCHVVKVSTDSEGLKLSTI